MELVSTRAGGNVHRSNIISHITDKHTKNTTTVSLRTDMGICRVETTKVNLNCPQEIQQLRPLTTSYSGYRKHAPSAKWTLAALSSLNHERQISRKGVGVSDGTPAPLPEARKARKVVLWHSSGSGGATGLAS